MQLTALGRDPLQNALGQIAALGQPQPSYTLHLAGGEQLCSEGGGHQGSPHWGHHPRGGSGTTPSISIPQMFLQHEMSPGSPVITSCKQTGESLVLNKVVCLWELMHHILF